MSNANTSVASGRNDTGIGLSLGHVAAPDGNRSHPKFNPALSRAMAESSGLFSPTLKLGATSTMNGLGTGKSRSIASIEVISSHTNPRSLISFPARSEEHTSELQSPM